ncbi:MAG: hypothetical protein LBU92_03245 [Prevotellaceae bacterium]|jgi:hypothetical protein|nr:hypothetical protein [Prevotellaceae bacterium]
MKKTLLLLVGMLSLATLAAAAPKNALEDSSLVRISSVEARVEFLNKIMREKLQLEDDKAAKVADINAKFEQQLQDLTIANPANPFGNQVKKKEETEFDKLSEAREKQMKKALSGKQYKEYEKQRWGIRTALKKQMVADQEERARVAREEAARQAALEKARQDSIVLAEAAAAKKKAPAKKTAVKGKKPGKKAPAKKGGAKKKKRR